MGGQAQGVIEPGEGAPLRPPPSPSRSPLSPAGGRGEPCEGAMVMALKLSGSRLRLGYRTIQKGPGVTVTLNSRPLSRLRQATWQHCAAAQVTELRKLTGSKNSLTKTFIVDLCKRSPTAF